MDLLKNLIEQKKKDVQELKKQCGNTDTNWFARREKERLEHENALKAQAEAEAKERAKEAQRLKELESFLASKKRPAEPATSASADVSTGAAKQRKVDETVSTSDEENNIPVERNEVIRRLRRRGEVTTYFGETDKQRYERLCGLEIAEHDDELMGGQRNVFLELMGENATGSLEPEVDEFAEKRAGKRGTSDVSAGAEEELSREDQVRSWVRRMLQVWEKELAERTEAEKSTTAGKVKTAQFRQTKKDLKPLMKKLRQRRVEEDVLSKIYDMVALCDKREYKLAHDKYIELSIGNAAWPMGVTMVGIHERAGRSKIFTSEIAHILNDETTRKYIHMLKRLISLSQRKFPTDPSKMVTLSTTHV